MNTLPHTQLPQKPVRHITIIGDSIAAGYGLPDYAWPSLLMGQLSETYPHFNWQLHNASIPGDTTADAYVRFDAVRRQPAHLALIALGVNDCRRASSPVTQRRIQHFRRNEESWWGKNPILRRIGNRLQPPTTPEMATTDASQVPLDDFLAILTWMVRQTQAMGALPGLITMPPLAPALAATPDFADCKRYNTAIRDIARETGAALVEISHALPTGAWQVDGVHPSATGQAELAQRVFLNFRRPPIAPHLGLEVPASNAHMAPSLD